MGSNNRRRSRVKGTTTLASASAIVTQMQTELHSLIARQRELTRRIRSVHRVVRGLREMSSTRVFNPPPARPKPSPEDGTIAGQSDGSHSDQTPPSHVRPLLDPASVVLQRACRIALMEAQTAVSLEEIYTRIARRGSFSFVDINHAHLTLSQLLSAMAKEGEIRLLGSGSSQRWERISQTK